MDGVIRQLYDFEGSNLFPRTKPSALVSDWSTSEAVGITTIGEWIDTSVPGNYIDPDTNVSVPYEPEFVYRIPRLGPDATLLDDEPGRIRAVKLSQVAALHFNAVLSEDFTVTNIVGIAGRPDNPHCPGGTYPAGTLLETMIMDILTGGGTVYDVQRILPNVSFTSVQITTDGVNWQSVSNNGSIEAGIGLTPKLRFAFTFTDGQYKPVSGYNANVFTLHNYTEHPENGEYFVSGTNPYMVTNSSTDSYTINNGVGGENNPVAGVTYQKTLNDITSGSKLYIITLHYTTDPNATSTPYKSDGTPSNNKVTNGDCSTTFRFTITGVQVEVYDVIVDHSPALTVDQFYAETTEIGVDVFNNNYTASANNANLILKSKYDVDHDTSTGIWTGDAVSLYTKKSLYPNWIYMNPNTDQPVQVLYNETTYDVVSPVVKYSDGIFAPQSGYPTNLFQQYNPTASETSLYGVCQLNSNPSVGIYKGSTSVYLQSTSYNTQIEKVVAAVEEPVTGYNVNSEYALWFKGVSGTVINTGTTTLNDAGNYTVKLRVPHTANTVTPKKSNGENSNVAIAANIVEKSSNTFEVKQEVDVDTISPSISIEAITIDGVGVRYNGNSVDISTSTISGHYTVVVSNKTGYFIPPQSSAYTDSEFNANNNTTGGKLAAGCQFSGVQIKQGNTVIGSCTGEDIGTTGHCYVYFTDLAVSSGDLTVKAVGTHGGSTVTAYKRSTRPSSVSIPATSALNSSNFVIHIGSIPSYAITIKANPSTGGQVKFAGGEWSSECTSTFLQGTGISMQAQASSGSTFVNWTRNGTSVSTSTTLEYTVTGACTFIANFNVPVAPKYAYLLTTDNLYTSGSTSLNVATVEEALSHQISGTYMVQENIANKLNNDPLTISLTSEQSFGYGKNWVTAIIPVAYDSTPAVHLKDVNNMEGWTLQDGTQVSGIKPYSSTDSTQYVIITKRSGSVGVAVKTIECNK
jgi:hypothetical protein